LGVFGNIQSITKHLIKVQIIINISNYHFWPDYMNLSSCEFEFDTHRQKIDENKMKLENLLYFALWRIEKRGGKWR
jgi:hypothetical protein